MRRQLLQSWRVDCVPARSGQSRVEKRADSASYLQIAITEPSKSPPPQPRTLPLDTPPASAHYPTTGTLEAGCTATRPVGFGPRERILRIRRRPSSCSRVDRGWAGAGYMAGRVCGSDSRTCCRARYGFEALVSGERRLKTSTGHRARRCEWIVCVYFVKKVLQHAAKRTSHVNKAPL